ncbi:MAG: (d)CMP kinase [Bacteroidetes bacterium]|nr:(d)CMP kinase [Bacteroidota bacterium]
MSEKIVVAIDGPAGSGKSTVAKKLAERMKCLYLDTGAMYRAVTYCSLENGIVDNAEAVGDLAARIDLHLQFENGITRVFVDGEEVTEKIRSAEVNSNVSEVAVIAKVREELVRQQREFGKKGSLIAEGRDMTTVVFPDADVKVYLTASIETRAIRRYKEYVAKNIEITIEEVRANIEKRDRIDSSRETSPLMQAEDAILFDNTSFTVEEDVEKLYIIIKEKVSTKV